MELTYPRFVHSEFMTHRLFSRNAASSRAIPIKKMIEAVKNDPVLPVWWGKAQSGMQAKEEVEDQIKEWCIDEWLRARDHAVDHVERLMNMGLHKQIPNRILEPWMWITVIVSATEWSNFFALRCHPDAQPEIQKIAYMAKALYDTSTPAPLQYGEWHLPYIDEEDKDVAIKAAFDYARDPWLILQAMSVARCARVSYTKQEEKKQVEDDLQLHNRLISSGHWSPFEHVATPLQPTTTLDGYATDEKQVWSGNLRGWKQYRKEFKNECL